MPSPCHLSPSPELGHQRVAPVSRVGGLPKLRSQSSHLLLLLDLCGEAECWAPGSSLTGSWGHGRRPSGPQTGAFWAHPTYPDKKGSWGLIPPCVPHHQPAVAAGHLLSDPESPMERLEGSPPLGRSWWLFYRVRP